MNAEKYHKVLRAVAAALVLISTFCNRHSFDLQEWDESRNGVNAYEMFFNGDYVNLYYDNEPDTWNAKPPLLVWSIALSYKVFGFNEFALRFPTAICALGFFMVLFVMIRRFSSETAASLTCLVLLSCKAIYGMHVGLTGDFDMMLAFFLTCSVYFFLLFLEDNKTGAVYLSAVCAGLAFYTKGPASLLLFPGLFLYVIIRRIGILKSVHIWMALILFAGIAGSWLAIHSLFGKPVESSFYGSETSVETMFVHDTYRRIFEKDFDGSGNINRDPLFLFTVLDSKFNIWNYLLFLMLILSVFRYARKHSGIPTGGSGQNLMKLSVCIVLPPAILFSFAHTAHPWYMAPAFPFIAFLVVFFFLSLYRQYKFMVPLGILVLVFTLSRQLFYLGTLPRGMHVSFTNNQKLAGREVMLTAMPSQDLLLYMKWLKVSYKIVSPGSALTKDDLVLVHKPDMASALDGFVIAGELGRYYLLTPVK